ncbi:MAG: adenylosuccinate synthase [Deltaproteobacteria bacterium]|nr:adenylosuccinate synthase [Deltaproteobacteria bacterium]MCB9490010.1 adenylosuccinate synthase [Deltaproteobacteria bacterium]
MSTVVIVGTQWGDEGKGMVVDLIAQQADMVVRYQGGDNAGHTVVVDGQATKLHNIPSGVLHEGTDCVIGDGVVINPRVLLEEIAELKNRGLLGGETSLRISRRAHVILPWHMDLDRAADAAKGDRRIGTTGRGIGPAYQSKMGRTGLRFGEFVEADTLADFIHCAIGEYNALLDFYNASPLDPVSIIAEYREYAEKLRPYACNTYRLIGEAVRAGRKVLFEGAHGTLLDIDHGTYPYVTSSNCVSGAVCTGAGVGPRSIHKIYGVVKAYTTRVGEGPFPTELTDELGAKLGQVGNEFGTTTGRKRRCGWLDLVITKYAAQLSDLTDLVITKLDVLDDFDEIKICTGYEVDGVVSDEMPAEAKNLAKVTPVYETLPGWKAGTCELTSYDDLPENAKKYLARIEDFLGIPVTIISVGPGRNQTIALKEYFD